MLDELREFKQYTGKLTDARFNIPTASSKPYFVGLERALLTIARYELEQEGYYSLGELTNDRISEIVASVTHALKVWFGLEKDENYSYSGWFENYYKKVFAKGDKDKWDKELANFEKKMKIPLFGKISDKNNFMNETTYQKVIAKAMEMGPLKKYYLVCKNGYTDNLYKESKSSGGKKLNTKNAKDSELVDNFLRLICVYLIENKRTGGAWCHVNTADLAHWASCDQLNKNSAQYFTKLTYKDDETTIIPVKTDNVQNMYAQRRINSSYLELYEFQVIEAEAYSKELYKDYLVFEDLGTKKLLSLKK